MNLHNRKEYKHIDIAGTQYKFNLDWLIGFFEGDGTFIIQLKPNKSHKIGYQVVLKFEIYQSNIDRNILEAIRLFLDCGKVELSKKEAHTTKAVYRYSISDLKSIKTILYPILNECVMITAKKSNDLNIFLAVLRLKSQNNTAQSSEGEKLKEVSKKKYISESLWTLRPRS